MSKLSSVSIREFQKLDDDLGNIDIAIDKLPIFSHLRARTKLGKRKEELVDATVNTIKKYYIEALEYDMEQAIAIYKTDAFVWSQEEMDRLDNTIINQKNESISKFNKDIRDVILRSAREVEENLSYIDDLHKSGNISETVRDLVISTLTPIYKDNMEMIVFAIQSAVKKQREMIAITLTRKEARDRR